MKKIEKAEIQALYSFADVIYKNCEYMQKRCNVSENALFWTLDSMREAANAIITATYALDALNRKREVK